MTIQDLKQKLEFIQYLGFDELRKIWVYSYRDIHNKIRMYGIIAGKQTVIEIPSLSGFHLTKAY